MARPLRIEYPGAVYHVTSRGNAGADIFLDDDDRRAFQEILCQIAGRFSWICHAFCLMGNHYHLLIETPDANLSKGMRQLNGVYTQYVNRRLKRAGHLFQGRFKSILVEKESHLLEVCRYVLLNPLRAGITNDLNSWKWSSYRAMIGLEKPLPCLHTEWVLSLFGDSHLQAAQSFQQFVADGAGFTSPFAMVTGQVLLGGREFKEHLSPMLKDLEHQREIPLSQRLAGRPELHLLLEGDDRNSRNAGIVDAVDTWGYSQKEVADCLGLHYSTISRILAVCRSAGVVNAEAVDEPAVTEASPVPEQNDEAVSVSEVPEDKKEHPKKEGVPKRGQQLTLF